MKTKRLMSYLIALILAFGVYVIPMSAYATEPTPTPAPAVVLADTTHISASKNLFDMNLFRGAFTRNVDDVLVTANSLTIITNEPIEIEEDIFYTSIYIRSKAFELPAGTYNLSMFAYINLSSVEVFAFALTFYVDGNYLINVNEGILSENPLITESFVLSKKSYFEFEINLQVYEEFEEPLLNEFKFIQIEQGDERTSFTSFVAPHLTIWQQALKIFNDNFMLFIGIGSGIILVIAIFVLISVFKKKGYRNYRRR